jgi:hypothetical protein
MFGLGVAEGPGFRSTKMILDPELEYAFTGLDLSG